MASLDDLKAKEKRLAGQLRELRKFTGTAKKDAEKARGHTDLVSRRSREAHSAIADIGPVPAVMDPERRASCEFDLLHFLVTYFPLSTGLGPFSTDHETMIAEMQTCILDGGRQVNAVYREFAKTTISENAILWATLYGHRSFALLTAVNKAASDGNVASLKSELSENDLLAEDFPEVCFPIAALDGKPQRAPSQTIGGEHTWMTWKADTIVFPIVAGSKVSGAIVMAKPFQKARGVKHKQTSGTQVRPDLILVDDPQDDESASSQLQVHKNLTTLKKNLLHATGHRRKLAIVVNGTVICKNDMMESLLVDTSWQGRRIKFVKKWSDAHEAFWLKQYAAIRRSYDRNIHGDLERAQRESTALYMARREEADAGCIVSWAERYTRPQEVSAIQHAYNVLIDDGEEVFASEYQNEPLDERAASMKLTAAWVAAKTNNLARGIVPKAAEYVTVYIDVHLRLLYYVVVAWSKDFTGSVIDYGTYPKQPVRYFSQTSAPSAMSDMLKGSTEDAWIQAGLRTLADAILGMTYRREDGAEMKVGMLLVDARWGEKNQLVKEFCRRHEQAGVRIMSSQGYGSGGVKPPLRLLTLKPGTREGAWWRIAPPVAGDRWVTIDTNQVKSFVLSRLLLPLATPGGLDLFGVDPREHSLFADHCVSEAPEPVSTRDITIDVWKWLLPHSDNHYWDCLCGCAVGASILGCRLPEWGEMTKRKRIRLSELQAGRR